MKFEQLKQITAAVSVKDYARAILAIDAALENEPGRDWNRELGKLRAFLADPARAPRWTVVKRDGNGKLPFAAFSALPGAGFCPGMGECANYCYSFKAWRYPAAFCRQVQGSVLLDSKAGRAHILAALDSLQPRDGSPLDFRLYVDGDFRSHSEIRFWFDALAARPWVKAYGYSKSLQLLKSYKGAAPLNYRLNISGGHKYSEKYAAAAGRLSFARGNFKAVSMGKKVKSSDHAKPEHRAELMRKYRAETGKKAFACPGKCGDCTSAGHACGSDKFHNLDIIIAVH